MGLIGLLIVLMIVGVLLYLAETVLPMDASIKVIIRAVVIICVLLWLVQVFLGDVPIPRWHR